MVNQSDLEQSDTNRLESIVVSASIDKEKWKSSPILYEWWDTPNRFKRRQLDDKECDIINVRFPLIFVKELEALLYIELVVLFTTVHRINL